MDDNKNSILNSAIDDLILQITNCLSEDDAITEEDAFSCIVNNYKFVFSRLGISDIITFSFEDYCNHHIVILNDIHYNLDEKFSADNKEEYESLCTIDSVIDALNFDSTEFTLSLILQQIEEIITDK